MITFTKKMLEKLYLTDKKSVAEIAKMNRCSENKANYWIRKYGIPKRSISEAMYDKYNPEGDPFSFQKPKKIDKAILYGLGIGLYWGEGTKSNRHSVRLGNTDPKLIRKFIEFLEIIFLIDKNRLKFGLQIFNDMNTKRALYFWRKELKVGSSQFYKVIITPSRGVGTYRKKTKYGVLTIYFNNMKLRDFLCDEIENLK